MNINLFNLTITLCRFLSYIPWKFNRREKTYQPIYSSIMIMVVFVDFIFLKSINIKFIITGLLMKCVRLTLIIQTMVNDNVWNKWFKMYEVTHWQFKSALKQTLNLKSNDYWIMISYIVLILSRQVYLCLTETDFCFFSLLMMYMRFFSTYLPIMFLQILKSGFQILSKYSKDLFVNKGKPKMRMNNRVGRSHMMLYKSLFELSICFNQLFGWLLALCMGNTLISICSFFQFFLKINFHKLEGTGIIRFCSLTALETVS